ncbi:cytochrome C [Thioclava sp. SK-1]|uniref:c-type cytochrome n=1 Tax=Thioclava sp. SK-1 TaxID=1889770 RepID=UPI0008252EB3|nr:cytochrome C [Thioclava sp. SK-1]OCX61417.1 cytochrome C [Thioclava sp. SK-1]
MKTSLFATLAAFTLAAPAMAQDVAAGEKEFRKCKACHMIEAADGTKIVKGGKVGPNLYGVIGRQVGGVDGFKYKDAIVAVGETGMVWTQEDLAAYITDPKAWLVEKTGDSGAASGMTHKQPKMQAEIAAYLASVAQ